MNGDKILRAWETPKYRGIIKGLKLQGFSENPACGDKILIDLVVKGGIIKDISHHGNGCVLSLAGAELLCELVQGHELDEMIGMTEAEMFKLYEGPPQQNRLLCGLLALKAFQGAVREGGVA